MTLPDALVQVRQFGDTQRMHHYGAMTPEGLLQLEPGEQVLSDVQGSPHVDGHVLPDQSRFIITNYRSVLLLSPMAGRAKWAGFGVLGLAVATTANVVEKRRAEKRTAGTMILGQLRHEWVSSIRLTHRKALIGVDTTLIVDVPTTRGLSHARWQLGARGNTEWGAMRLVHAVTNRWLDTPAAAPLLSDSDRARLNGYRSECSIADVSIPDPQEDRTWTFPETHSTFAQALEPSET